jgi:hypothetical protein
LEDRGVYERIILRWIFRKWDGGNVDRYYDLPQGRDTWQALVNAVMNLQFP